MKLSDMVGAYTSQLLVDKGNDTFHFEVDHTAFTVKRSEIEFI